MRGMYETTSDRARIRSLERRILDSLLGILIVGIIVLAANLFLTVRNESNETFFLLPIGMGLFIIGLAVWIQKARKKTN